MGGDIGIFEELSPVFKLGGLIKYTSDRVEPAPSTIDSTGVTETVQ